MSLPLRLEDVLPAAVVSSYSDPAAARPLRRHVHPASSSGGDSSDSNSISISGMPSPPRLVLCAQEPGAADGEFVAALMLCRLLREDPPTTTTAPAAAPSSSYAAGTAPASRVARRGRVKCLIFNHSKQGVDVGSLEAAGVLSFCVLDINGGSDSIGDKQLFGAGGGGDPWGDARRRGMDFIFGMHGSSSSSSSSHQETEPDKDNIEGDHVLFIDDLNAFEIFFEAGAVYDVVGGGGSPKREAETMPACNAISRLLRPTTASQGPRCAAVVAFGRGQHQGSAATGSPGAENPTRPPLVEYLRQRADAVVSVRPLSSGHAVSVHGLLLINDAATSNSNSTGAAGGVVASSRYIYHVSGQASSLGGAVSCQRLSS